MKSFLIDLVAYICVCLVFWLAMCFVTWSIIPVDPGFARLTFCVCVFLAALAANRRRLLKEGGQA